jgi:DNA replication initiation complex subunit (GINS family)
MISYADLESAFRRERASPILQELPVGFYSEGRQLAANPDLGEHSDAVREHLQKIYLQRVNKIIHAAGRATPDGRPPENMMAEERMLYNRIVEAVAENKAAVLDRQVEVVKEKSGGTVKVRMKKALPAIAGSDATEYGPFKADDIAELPEDTARMLIEKDVAEEI